MSFGGYQQEKSLGELLVQSGRLQPEELQKALTEQQRTAEPLGKTLVRLGYVQERDILQVLQGLLVVIFHLDQEHFAFEALYVREIIRWQVLNHIPQMPDYFEGLLNHRGSVIPIISLARRLGLKPIPANEETRIIIVECSSQIIGLVVDLVEAVMQLPLDRLENTPAALRGIDTRFIYGLGKIHDRLITVLQLENVIAGVEVQLPSSGTSESK